MLHPDLEMGYVDNEEAIPALTGAPAYPQGTHQNHIDNTFVLCSSLNVQ